MKETWIRSESNACWFLFVQTLRITNKKREAAPKNEASGDEKHLFLLLLLLVVFFFFFFFFFLALRSELFVCTLITYDIVGLLVILRTRCGTWERQPNWGD